MGLEVGNIVAVSFVGEVLGQRTINTIHLRRASPVDPAKTVLQDLDDITFHMQPDGGGADWLETDFRACCAQNWDLLEIVAQQLTPVRSVKRVRVEAVQGTWPSDCEASNLAAVISKRTNFGGRDQVGRIHLPGFPHNAAADGLVSSGLLTELNDLCAALDADYVVPVTGVSYNNCLYHKGESPDFDIVTEHFPQTTIRVMRRRTVGLGI